MWIHKTERAQAQYFFTLFRFDANMRIKSYLLFPYPHSTSKVQQSLFFLHWTQTLALIFLGLVTNAVSSTNKITALIL
jgi:hypothetical protein